MRIDGAFQIRRGSGLSHTESGQRSRKRLSQARPVVRLWWKKSIAPPSANATRPAGAAGGGCVAVSVEDAVGVAVTVAVAVVVVVVPTVAPEGRGLGGGEDSGDSDNLFHDVESPKVCSVWASARLKMLSPLWRRLALLPADGETVY